MKDHQLIPAPIPCVHNGWHGLKENTGTPYGCVFWIQRRYVFVSHIFEPLDDPSWIKHVFRLDPGYGGYVTLLHANPLRMQVERIAGSHAIKPLKELHRRAILDYLEDKYSRGTAHILREENLKLTVTHRNVPVIPSPHQPSSPSEPAGPHR